MNGNIIDELRNMARADELSSEIAIRLILSSQAEIIECYKLHRHDSLYAPRAEYALMDHKHDSQYASKDHKHPLEYLTAGITALIAAAYAAFKP
jgi:hypothetical protein